MWRYQLDVFDPRQPYFSGGLLQRERKGIWNWRFCFWWSCSASKSKIFPEIDDTTNEKKNIRKEIENSLWWSSVSQNEALIHSFARDLHRPCAFSCISFYADSLSYAQRVAETFCVWSCVLLHSFFVVQLCIDFRRFSHRIKAFVTICIEHEFEFPAKARAVRTQGTTDQRIAVISIKFLYRINSIAVANTHTHVPGHIQVNQ